MKLILMNHTIEFLNAEANKGNQKAMEILLLGNYMEIVRKEKYIILLDKNTDNIELPDNNKK